MSIFDRFKKKKKDFDIDSLADQEMAHDPFAQDDFGTEKSAFPDEKQSAFPSQPQQQDFTRPLGQATPSATGNKDLELINSKLDTIKAMLNSLDQRIAHLEKSSGGEKRERLW